VSQGTGQILAELIQAGGSTSHSDIHKHIKCIWNKEEQTEQWMEFVIVTVCKKGNKTSCSSY
jgi:hypothetical protein